MDKIPEQTRLMEAHNKLRVPTIRENQRAQTASAALKAERDTSAGSERKPVAYLVAEPTREPPSLKWVFRLTLAVLLTVPLGLFALKEIKMTPSERAARDTADRLAREKQAVLAAEESREKAFKCLSYWSGEMLEFSDVVRGSLRDPSSFEHLSTFVSAVNLDGSQYVTMRFRARNGFGGLIEGSAKGTIQNNNCKLINWRML